MNYSISLNAKVSAASSTITPGVLVSDSGAGYAPGTANPVTAAVAITYATAGGSVNVQTTGLVPAALTGLGPGSASYVIADPATGGLSRKASPTGSDFFVGSCDAAGNVILNLNNPPTSIATKPVGITVTGIKKGQGIQYDGSQYQAIGAAPVYNVSSYGTIEDGVSDDSVGINAAILAAGKGKVVKLTWPTIGYYYCTNPIIIDSANGSEGLEIVGEGPGADSANNQVQIIFRIPPVSGTTASITSVSVDPNGTGKNNVLTLSGVTGLAALFAPPLPGDEITISNADTAGNNWSCTILSVNVATGVVTCLNNNYAIDTQGALCAAPDANNGAIHWTITRHAIKCWSRGVKFKNLYLNGTSNSYTAAVIDATKGTGGPCTNICLENVQLANARYALKIGDFGPNDTYPNNCENFTVVKSFSFGISDSHVYIPNTTGQSKAHEFRFYGTNGGKYVFNTITGSFSVYHGQFGGVTGSVALIGGGADTITFYRVDCENSARLLQTRGSTGASWVISLDGIRYDTTNAYMAGDGQVIQFSWGGGLSVTNSEFSYGVSGITGLCFAITGGSSTALKAMVRNCKFPRADTNIVQSLYGGASVYWSEGNECYDGTTYRTCPNGMIPILSPNFGPQMQLLGFALPAKSMTLANGSNNDVAAPTAGYPPVFSSYEITGPTGAFSITGIQAGVDGQVLELLNLTSQAMTFAHQNASSSASNRIVCLTGADVTLSARTSYARLKYSSSQSRWILLNTT